MYKYISQDKSSITFANAINPDSIIRFTADRTTVKQNGVQVPIVRTNTLFVVPKVVTKCKEKCSDSAVIQQSIRILTSGEQGSSTELIASLRSIITALEERPDYFNGFLPSTADTVADPIVLTAALAK